MWQEKRRPHFYGINISSRNVDNVHARDTCVAVGCESIGWRTWHAWRLNVRPHLVCDNKKWFRFTNIVLQQIAATAVCFVLFLCGTLSRVSVCLCVSMCYENFSRKKEKAKAAYTSICARRLLFSSQTESQTTSHTDWYSFMIVLEYPYPAFAWSLKIPFPPPLQVWYHIWTLPYKYIKCLTIA